MDSFRMRRTEPVDSFRMRRMYIYGFIPVLKRRFTSLECHIILSYKWSFRKSNLPNAMQND